MEESVTVKEGIELRNYKGRKGDVTVRKKTGNKREKKGIKKRLWKKVKQGKKAENYEISNNNIQ